MIKRVIHLATEALPQKYPFLSKASVVKRIASLGVKKDFQKMAENASGASFSSENSQQPQAVQEENNTVGCFYYFGV